MEWLTALDRNRRRGSFPRCLLLTNGNRKDVADRLQQLIGISSVTLSEGDFWMPKGLPALEPNGDWDKTNTFEAILGKTTEFLSANERELLANWWLAVRESANMPNWDIASTCTIGNKRGLLLVEAKAHDKELSKSGKSKPTNSSASLNSALNHEQIGSCIEEANSDLRNETQLSWALSNNSHYQMSNRFAWSWKLTELGYPVILVYLGFLLADEMRDIGEPFANHAQWEQIVRSHSAQVVPADVWNREWVLHGQSFIPLIRSFDQPLFP